MYVSRGSARIKSDMKKVTKTRNIVTIKEWRMER